LGVKSVKNGERGMRETRCGWRSNDTGRQPGGGTRGCLARLAFRLLRRAPRRHERRRLVTPLFLVGVLNMALLRCVRRPVLPWLVTAMVA